MDISFFSLLSFYLISRFSVCARCIVLKQGCIPLEEGGPKL